MPAEILGLFRLPISIPVGRDALGASYRTRIGGTQVDVRLPEASEVSDPFGGPQLRAPRIAIGLWHAGDDGDGDRAWGMVRAWTDEGIVTAEVRMVGLKLIGIDREEMLGMNPDDSNPLPRTNRAPIDGVVREVAGWFDSLTSWIEVGAPRHDLGAHPPLSGSAALGEGLQLQAFEEDRPITRGWTSHEFRTRQPAEPGLSRAELASAFSHAADGPPELVDQLLVDARRLLRRGDQRRSVLDAGLAAEIALRSLLADCLSDLSVAKRAVMSDRRMTIGPLIDLVAALVAADRSPSVSLDPKELKAELVNPRNRATHRKDEPVTHAEALKALHHANNLVRAAFSLT